MQAATAPLGLPRAPEAGGTRSALPEPAEASGPNFMPLNLYYPGLKKVNQTPPIYTVDKFLTPEECDAFIETAKPLLQRSKTHAVAGICTSVASFTGKITPQLYQTDSHLRCGFCVSLLCLQEVRQQKGAPHLLAT